MFKTEIGDNNGSTYRIEIVKGERDEPLILISIAAFPSTEFKLVAGAQLKTSELEALAAIRNSSFAH